MVLLYGVIHVCKINLPKILDSSQKQQKILDSKDAF